MKRLLVIIFLGCVLLGGSAAEGEPALGFWGNPWSATSLAQTTTPVAADEKMHEPDGYQGIGWLLVAIAAIATGYNQICQAIDRRKPHQIEQPVAVTSGNNAIEVKQAAIFVTNEVLNAQLASCATKNELRDMEMRIEGKSETNFRALDQKRSVSTAQLHTEVRRVAEDLTKASEERINKVHDRLNEVVNKVGELTGEMRHVASAARDAAKAANAAAASASNSSKKAS